LIGKKTKKLKQCFSRNFCENSLFIGKDLRLFRKKALAGSLNVPTNLILSKILDWRWGLKDKRSY